MMTTGQAKKDAAARLMAAGATYASLSAKTISFEDMARGSKVFVTVKSLIPLHGDWSTIQAIQDDKTKGYVLHLS